MPRLAASLALVALLALAAPAEARRADPPVPPRAKVVHVDDGDTLVVEAKGRRTSIRLVGIDCPELDQPFGQQAKAETRRLTLHRTLTVRDQGADVYGRRLAEVFLPDGTSLNAALVRSGHAWHFVKYSKDARLARLERQARQARRGLWSAPSPTAPWDHRAIKRKPRGPKEPRPAPPPDAPILGNRNSRIYHRPDCPNYADVSPRNRVPFATEEAARDAGYRRARNCP